MSQPEGTSTATMGTLVFFNSPMTWSHGARKEDPEKLYLKYKSKYQPRINRDDYLPKNRIYYEVIGFIKGRGQGHICDERDVQFLALCSQGLVPSQIPPLRIVARHIVSKMMQMTCCNQSIATTITNSYQRRGGGGIGTCCQDPLSQEHDEDEMKKRSDTLSRW